LRCNDISCGIGPSDEEPFSADLTDPVAVPKRLSIKTNGGGEVICPHTFHGACLVSAERVAQRGVDVVMDSDGHVEVSCPVCRGMGYVSKEEWNEGVVALQ